MLTFSNKFVSAGREYSSYAKHIRAPLFRKSFVLQNKPEQAEILITGLGFYRLFVNGTDITKGFLAPYISNTDQLIYYDAYDLAPYLTEGENVIGVMLGDGMQNLITNVWDFDKVVFTSAPKLALTCEIVDHEQTLSFEADSFVCTEGPITFNNHRCGVHYDARLELDGWNKPGFDASDWRAPIKPDPPRGKAKLCEADPIVVRSEYPAVSVRVGEVEPYTPRGDVREAVPYIPVEGNPPYTGGYIYDFGKNSAGIYRLTIRNTTPGQKISLQCAETLTKEGKLDYRNIDFYPDGYAQRDIYICRGGEQEVYIPSFTYHGYRYLYVHGIREDQATLELLTYVEINTRLQKRVAFACSDERVNALYAICDNSDQSNFHYFPTDCPQREKNGWTGDAAASSEHMVMTLSVENSWREWMTNMRYVQDVAGRIPGIVPTVEWGFDWCSGPAWDRVIFDLPYYTYIYRGETAMITENAHMMLRYLEWLTRMQDKHGIVHEGLGDWCAAGRGGGDYAVPLGFTNGIMIMDMCRKASVMFRAVGLNLHAAFAEALGAQSKAATRKQYLDTATMTIEGGYQTGQAMAVYYDLLEPGEKKQAVEVLVDLIHKADDHMSVGYLGARVIFHVLSDFGYTDLAYKMITRDDNPSYGEILKEGFTTMPECFMTDIHQCGSYNHHFFCDIKQWFLRQLGGINVNPDEDDPNMIFLKPHFASELDFVNAEYEAPGGKISVSWKRNGEQILLSVKKQGDIHFRIRLEGGYAFADTKLRYDERDNEMENRVVIQTVL